MAQNDRYVTPEYGIPKRFKTPIEEHRDRLAAIRSQAQTPESIDRSLNSWLPGIDFINTLVLSTSSSFFSGFAGDAKSLDYIFDADVTKDAEHNLRDISNKLNSFKPTRARTAAEKIFIKDDGSMGEAWSDIYAYADLAGSGLGSIAAMVLGGGLLKVLAKGGLRMYTRKAIRKQADKLAKKSNISDANALKQAERQMTDYAKKYDSAIGMGAYGTAEMAIVSGSVGHAIEQEVMRAPADVINTSPRFRELYYELKDNNELNHDQAHNLARIKLSREAGIQGAKEVAIPSLLLGSVAGRYINKAITGNLTKSTLANFAILEGIEIPTEAAQGAVEQYVQNKTYKELVDKSRNIMAGIPDAAFREGAGVAFGVAPLSLIAAKIEADIRKTGENPDMDKIDDEDELRIIDLAAKLDEAATETAMEIQDPVRRYEALAEIIAKGNAGVEGEGDVDLDLDLDEAAVEEMGEPQVPEPRSPFEDDPEEVIAPEGEIVTPAPVAPEEPAEPTPAPPEGPVTGGPAVPVAETPVIMPPATEPAHKVDFEAFREGKRTGAYQLPPPTGAAVTFGTEDISTAPRAVLNRVGKALGLKTAVSRYNLEQRIKSLDKFTDLDLETAAPVDIAMQMQRMSQIMSDPVDISRMDDEGIMNAAVNLQERMKGSVNEFIDREQHRGAIEAAVEAGDFTLGDFNALPESDQKAYAAIGRRLLADARGETPTPPPEDVLPPPPEEVAPEPPATGEPGEEGGLPPEGEPPITGPPAAPEGQPPVEPPIGEPPVEPPIAPPEPVDKEGTPPESEPEPAEVESDEVKVAQHEAILEGLSKLEEGNKITVYGKTLTGNKDMKPEVLEFMTSADGVYNFKRGKMRRKLQVIDGQFYVTSLSNKRSRVVTEIERKKRFVKDVDEESGSLLRRPHEIWKEGPKNLDDAEKALKTILTAVGHASYINAVNYGGKTHGVKRFYTDIMSGITPFLKWIAPHIGSSHGGTSPKEAVLAVLREQPLTQFHENRKLNIQTPDELLEVVDSYVEMMGAIQAIIAESNNTLQVRDNLAKSEFEGEVLDSILAMDDDAFKTRHDEFMRDYRDKGEDVIPVAKEEDSLRLRFPAMFPKLNYSNIFHQYLAVKKFENISDEKLLPKVPRERQKLSELAAARNGMPDHRKGKNITRDDLMGTFGFIDVVYGDWVSATALEGSLSERQQYRNLVYDAFSDLAYLTGLPLKVMGSDLYLSLGSLGHGKKTGLAFFHPSHQLVDVSAEETEDNIRDLRIILDNNDVDYEMDESAKSLFAKVGKVIKQGDAKIDLVRVIHFNKENGNGAFAHEWTHNLGNKLKRLEQNMAESLQQRPSVFGLHRYIKRAIKLYIKERGDYYDEEELIENLKGNLEATLRHPSDFIKPTSYMKNSTFMDRITGGHGGKPYWKTKHEMFARATEAYIYDAILAEGDGAANPFLQGKTAAEGFVSPQNGYLATVYPDEEERQYFNGLLKQMFEDIEADENGQVKFEQDGEDYSLRFGLQAELDRIVADYESHLEEMVEQARDDRLEGLLEEDDDEETNLLEGMSDEDLDDLLGEVEPEEPDKPKRPKSTTPRDREGRPRGRTRERGAVEGKKQKTTKEMIDELEKKGGYTLSDKQKGILDDLMSGDEKDDTRFSLSVGDFNDTRFSVETIQDRNPDLDPELYEKILKLIAPMYAQFRDAGNQNMGDFGRGLQEQASEFIALYRPYFLQFLKDVRDGQINYRDYVDASDQAADEDGKRPDDGADIEGQDDGTGVQQPTDEQTDPDAGAGTGVGGTAGVAPDGEGTGGRADLVDAGDNALEGLSAEELAERIQKETGLRSPSVEPLPSNLGVSAAQVPKVPVAAVREYESEYQVPTSMSENMENAVLSLQDLIIDEGYEDLDDYVMQQLGYEDQSTFDDAYMSLQVEAIAAAIYQMNNRRRSVIVADQTGVGKGRQAGGLIRWAIKQGHVPIFVTAADELYTDMYYDMVDSGTTNVVPFITNTGVGVKDRDFDPDEAAELEHRGKKVPLLHKRPNTETVASVKAMAKNGRLPAGANAVFTTYDQMNQAGPRREALLKLADTENVILILDESHKAAKFDPQKNRTNRNEYFTDLIKRSRGTTYLSATFAKNPENLAFYFNTDLADAMDGMKQLVDVLSTGGIQLQEVMSRALTRNGQLFRREISYENVDIATEFDDKNQARDKGYVDNLTDVIQALIPVNKEIVRDLKEQFDDDPMGVGTILLRRQEISESDMARIAEAVQSGFKIKVTFTPILNQIHNLSDQILVASKADLAVDKILDDFAKGQKAIIGLDKTNMAMMHEFITRAKKSVGDDMSDLNWASLLRFWGQKSFNVSISIGENPKDSERIRGNLGDQSVDPGLKSSLDAVGTLGDEALREVDLPLSPIDYIAQTAMAQSGGKINVREITGRYSGDFGIDYSDGKQVLYKVDRFHKRDVIDAFNGEVKDSSGNKIPSTIDALVINQSGSTGVSLHSSVKHGDRKIRHMTIVEPAGDINVFQQMLGRIFRTGMGDTYPLYTVLASSIPSDARKINVLRKKMESLNAQTSSNREGAAGVSVEDIMNEYGDAAVEEWVQNNQEFQDLFPNWEKQKEHKKGFAYWVTGKITLFNFNFQQDFYSEVSSIFNSNVEQAKAEGTYTLEERFYEWNAKYLEEITLAEPRKEGTGFNSGSWLVKLLAETDFRAMNPEAVAAAVEEGKAVDISPEEGKLADVLDYVKQSKDDALQQIQELKPEDEENRSLASRFETYRAVWDRMYRSSVKKLLGDEVELDRVVNMDNSQVESWRDMLEEIRDTVRDALPKGGKDKFDKLERIINRTTKSALNKVNQERILKRLKVGKTYNITIGSGTDHQHQFQGTVIGFNRLNKTIDPYTLGDIEINVAANKPGGTDSKGVITRTLGQIDSSWSSSLVREFQYGTPDNVSEIYTKYHDTLAETSNTIEEWVAIGNPLIAASEIIPQGEYMQFSDSYGRRMFGIRMPKAAVKLGVEGMIRGNLEIPAEAGGQIITSYISENPHSRISREFGFRTRGNNVIIALDNMASNHIRVRFDIDGGAEKANDPILLEMLKQANVQMLEFESSLEFSVPFTEAQPIINQVLRRSRVVVQGSMKHLLKNYMDITDSTKAGEHVVSVVNPNDVKTYVFDTDDGKVTAHRGEYKTKGGAVYDGFYMEGLGRYFNLKDIARLTMMKGRDGEHQGRPFLRMDEFVRGRVQNGTGENNGLGKPMVGESIKTDGTSFSASRTISPAVKIPAEAARAVLETLPFRLKRLVKVVQSEAELPFKVRAKMRTRNIEGRVKGVFHEGRIYIVANGLVSPEQAMVVFLHEGVGHLGVRKLMGEDLDSLLDRVARLYPQEMRELSQQYNVSIASNKGRREIAEEVLAHIAEKDDNQGLMDRIVALFRKMMRVLGFNLILNENDVRAILAAARRSVDAGGFATDGTIAQPTPRFSLRSKTADVDGTLPEDTVLQAIKDGQPVDAVFRGMWGIFEATRIPKVVKATSAATLRGALNFYDNHMGWAHPAMQHMAKGLIDQYGLDKEYKALRASTQSMKSQIIDEVRDIIQVMEAENVNDEDAAMIHEILTKEEPRAEAWDAVTEPIRKRVEELGQQAVDLNLISQESYDRNKGMYLHRVYMKYEENRSGLQKWADNLSGKRAAKIKGTETMERGLSIFVPLERILADTGLTEGELMTEDGGITIYKIDQMSANGQKSLNSTYSLKPLKAEGYKVQEFYVRAKHAGRVKLHRDWTKAERVDMGQITDARYVLGKTFSLLAHDLSTGKFFDEISKNEAWTMPVEQEKAMEGEIMSGESALRLGIVSGAEWVRVPTTGIRKSQAKVYGALSGRVVRAEIFQDLNQLNKMQQNSVWKAIMTSFKLNKTARNPVVHFNNIMSNLVLMDMADVRFSDLYRAIVEMKVKGDLYNEAKTHGAFGVSFAEHDLKNEVLDKLLDEIHEATGVKPVGLEDIVMQMDKLPFYRQFAFMMKLLDGLWHGVDIKGKKVGLKNLDKKMLNYYQHEDEVFRMATFMRRRAQGMDAVEAGMSARDQFLNYDISAPWINALRASVLPFISYTYRAVPIVAKSIAQRPWKLAKYFTIAYGMNAIGYALTGGDEEKERKSLRDEVSGRLWIGSDRLIRMPWNNIEGNPYFWDVRRLIPVGDVFDMNQYHAALPIIPAALMPSGPIAIGFEFMLNKTGFFGQEIVDPLADDNVIATQKTLDWLWKSYGPSAPWIPYSYYWEKMDIAISGGRDRLGRDYEVIPALMSSFGVKIAPHDVAYGVALKGMVITRTVQAIRHRLGFLEKDYWQGKISKSKYESTRKRYIMKLERLEEQARDLTS